VTWFKPTKTLQNHSPTPFFRVAESLYCCHWFSCRSFPWRAGFVLLALSSGRNRADVGWRVRRMPATRLNMSPGVLADADMAHPCRPPGYVLACFFFLFSLFPSLLRCSRWNLHLSLSLLVSSLRPGASLRYLQHLNYAPARMELRIDFLFSGRTT
jgi:hypothetical protein